MKRVVNLCYFFLFSFVISYPLNAIAKYADALPTRIVITSSKQNMSGAIVNLQIMKAEIIGQRSESWDTPWRNLPGESDNGIIKWELPTQEAIRVRFEGITGDISWFLMEPGDSIQVKHSGEMTTYTGRGKEKFSLIQELNNLPDISKKPQNNKFYRTSSVGDYLEWSDYLNQQKEQIHSILEKYKNKVSPYALNYIKAAILSAVERKRMLKFIGFYGMVAKDTAMARSIANIYDSTIINKDTNWLNEIEFQNENTSYYYDYVNMYVRRNYGFKNYPERFQDDQDRHRIYYDVAKTLFYGPNIYSCLTYILTEKVIKENLYSQYAKDMLEDYRLIHMPERVKQEYLNYVDSFMNVIRWRSIRMGIETPDFSLESASGKRVEKKDWKHKTVLFNFLDPDKLCVDSVTTAISNIQSAFGNNPNVVIANLLPLNSKGNMETKGMLRCLPQSTLFFYDDQHDPVTKDFDVHSLPVSYIFNSRGQFVKSPFNDLLLNNGRSAINLITEQVDFIYDGPYIEYNGDTVNLLTATPDGIKREKRLLRDGVSFTIKGAQEDAPINVSLKPLPIKEPSVYAGTGRIFAVSDIEGNFSAFKKLLVSNGVMDSTFNWTFGNGRLVLIGDFLDRGNQVTECLWMIYALEEKAKMAGGYVHFILGNHEIMNLSGDDRYINDKYRKFIKEANVTYQQLLTEKTELGRWLRTKNVIEKIGDYLFVHGGISEEVNEKYSSLADINDIARKYYDKTPDIETIGMNPVLDGKLSPYWYRYYYSETQDKKASNAVVDKTMNKFSVKHIVTGHTIVADTVTLHYDAKIINVDTPHKYGKSEGLLIEGESLYGVDVNGVKRLLSPK